LAELEQAILHYPGRAAERKTGGNLRLEAHCSGFCYGFTLSGCEFAV
jgi:hypothetical protein